jgi:hypothetical protein
MNFNFSIPITIPIIINGRTQTVKKTTTTNKSGLSTVFNKLRNIIYNNNKHYSSNNVYGSIAGDGKSINLKDVSTPKHPIHCTIQNSTQVDLGVKQPVKTPATIKPKPRRPSSTNPSSTRCIHQIYFSIGDLIGRILDEMYSPKSYHLVT